MKNKGKVSKKNQNVSPKKVEKKRRAKIQSKEKMKKESLENLKNKKNHEPSASEKTNSDAAKEEPNVQDSVPKAQDLEINQNEIKALSTAP